MPRPAPGFPELLDRELAAFRASLLSSLDETQGPVALAANEAPRASWDEAFDWAETALSAKPEAEAASSEPLPQDEEEDMGKGGVTFSMCNFGSVFGGGGAMLPLDAGITKQTSTMDGTGSVSAAAFCASPIWSNDGARTSTRISEITCLITTLGSTDFLFESESHWAFHPESSGVVLFATLGALLVCFDTVVLPLLLSGVLKESLPLGLSVGVLLYWVTDLIFNFMTGFHKNLDVIMELKPIAIRYLSTWFLLDVLLIGIDVHSIIQDSRGGSLPGTAYFTEGTSLLRLLRLLRLHRLLRLRRSYLVNRSILSGVFAQGMVSIFLRVVHLILLILLLNHFIACAWFALGVRQRDEQLSWMSHLEDDPLWLYTCALHWSITQFTPATQDLAPKNTAERSFAIAVVFLALVCFSTFLGKMTSAMTELLHFSEEDHKQKMVLGRFCTDRGLSVKLRREIMACWTEQHHAQTKVAIRQASVPYLKEMPQHLQFRLSLEIYAQYLYKYRCFQSQQLGTHQVVALICQFAMREGAAVQSSDIFVPHTVALDALFVTSGDVAYKFRRQPPRPVRHECWIVEQCLIGDWKHRGWLVAQSSCTFVRMNGESFREQVMKCRGYFWGRMCQYAKLFEASSRSMVCPTCPRTKRSLF